MGADALLEPSLIHQPPVEDADWNSREVRIPVRVGARRFREVLLAGRGPGEPGTHGLQSDQPGPRQQDERAHVPVAVVIALLGQPTGHPGEIDQAQIGVLRFRFARQKHGAPALKAFVVADQGRCRHVAGDALIRLVEQRDRQARPPVAPAAAHLLIETVEGLRQRGMDHRTYVGLVHADAESGGGDDAVEAVIHPVVDNALALGAARFAVEAGEPPISGHAQLLKPLAGIIAGGRVEDEGPRDIAQQFHQPLPFLVSVAHTVAEIAGLRAQMHRGDHLQLLGRAEQGLQGLDHRAREGRGQQQGAECRALGTGAQQAPAHAGQLLERRPKVISPLGDQMGLIDHQVAQRAPFGGLVEGG